MQNIKMIVTDLDRTLLRTDKTISDYTISVFERVREKEILIVFATARPVRTVTQFALAINPEIIIYHNGAVIHHVDKSVEKTSIAIDVARRIIHSIVKLFPNTMLSAEINDILYANFDVSTLWNNTSAIKTDFLDLPDLPVDKMIVGISSMDEVEAISKLLPPHLYAEIADNKLALIMHKDATKLNAIKSVAKKCGVELCNITAFGDDYNDIEMIRKCGVGVAVENAIYKVKDVTDYRCDTNDNDGVAKWIEENVL